MDIAHLQLPTATFLAGIETSISRRTVLEVLRVPFEGLLSHLYQCRKSIKRMGTRLSMGDCLEPNLRGAVGQQALLSLVSPAAVGADHPGGGGLAAPRTLQRHVSRHREEIRHLHASDDQLSGASPRRDSV